MGRSPCCDKNGLKKGPWTPEEDLKLIHYIQLHGPGNWRTLPKNAGLQRCGKSCRLRWTNYLRPDIKRGRFSFEEEETIIQLHSILGNKWSAIAARLPGRTDNEIKNYWNTHIRKRLLRMGIDPVTHSPRLDLLDLSSILSSNQLNLSNLLGLHTLLNPELLRLTTLLASSSSPNQQNPESLLQKLQEIQLYNNAQYPNLQNQTPPMLQPSEFQTTTPISVIPRQDVPTFSDSIQNQSTQHNIGQSTANLEEGLSSQGFQENLTPPSLLGECGFASLTNYGFDNSSFQSLINNNGSSQNVSLLSSSCTEDERESYCSSMLKFEIPESLDFDDFI